MAARNVKGCTGVKQVARSGDLCLVQPWLPWPDAYTSACIWSRLKSVAKRSQAGKGHVKS